MRVIRLVAVPVLACSMLFGSGLTVAADYADGLAAYESKDYKTALEVFTPLAEQEDEGAQYYLGLLYDRGKGGVRKNKKTANQWLIKAAEQGLARAQHHVGIRYLEGYFFGLERNSKTAFKWFTKAAEQGFSPAYSSLGWLYQKGYGVLKNNKTAIKWYLKSIGQGHYGDANYLGDLYLKVGDYVRAYMWYSIDGENGHRSSVKDANKIAADMTTREINKAQKMADRCLASNYTDC